MLGTNHIRSRGIRSSARSSLRKLRSSTYMSRHQRCAGIQHGETKGREVVGAVSGSKDSTMRSRPFVHSSDYRFENTQLTNRTCKACVFLPATRSLLFKDFILCDRSPLSACLKLRRYHLMQASLADRVSKSFALLLLDYRYSRAFCATNPMEYWELYHHGTVL
jgi:hypothetical protein